MLTIDGCFRKSADRYPDRIAMQYYQDESWDKINYAEMLQAVNVTAAGLGDLGVVDSTKVAIMSENRPEWVVSYMAIVSMGGIAVPIDALLGESETEHILNHSEATTILCSMRCYEVISRIISNLSALKNIVIFDRNITVRHDHRGHGEGQKVVNSGRRANGKKIFLSYDELRTRGLQTMKKGVISYPTKDVNHLASIIYTSGTTGTPKGVLLTHKNFIANVESFAHIIKANEEDNFLLLLPLHHVFPFTTCLVFSAMLGAALSFVDILSRDRTRLIMECQPTLMLGVPLLYSKIFRGIIRQVEASKIKNFIYKYGGKRIIGKALKKKLGGKLRYMISGAAAMEPDVIKGFTSLGIKFIEGYGLTESSPVVSANPPDAIKIGSIGPPVHDVEVKILNPDSEGVGEIVVRGENIMQGYYKNPEQTAAVIKNGWFHTGDLGRMDEDNYIFITGRAKDVIVNRGGKNVYPDVVESEINKSRFIAESVVIGYATAGRVGEDVGVLIYPDYEALYDQAKKDGVTFKEHISIDDLTEDAKDELIGKYRILLEDEVKKSMTHLAPHQRVSRIAIERDEFVKTSTRKIKRFLYKGRLDILQLS